MIKDSKIVSVCMVAYKQASYIKEAILGVLMQKVNFEIQLFIGDDCSPDNTSQIVEEIKKNHPNGKWITYIRRGRNIGMMPNFIDLLERCKGNYIALCDGDDYWTDPLKLQKQVDFLEANEDYVISFHDCEVRDEVGNLINESKLGDKGKYDLTQEQIVSGSLIPTMSVVFRNIPILQNLPQEFYQVKNGDLFLFALLGQFGRARFHDDIKNAIYRVHDGGIWSNNQNRIKDSVNSYKKLMGVIGKKYNRKLKRKYLRKISTYSIILFKEKKYNLFLNLYISSFFMGLRELYLKPFFAINRKIIFK